MTHWRTPEERAEAHRRDARKDTRRTAWRDTCREPRKDARRDAWQDSRKDALWHARMEIGGTHGWCMEAHGGAHSLTHGRTPEERAEEHRWDAQRDTRRGERWDAQKDAWWHARMEIWDQDGNWGGTWKVHGDTRWGTRLDAEEDIGRNA